MAYHQMISMVQPCKNTQKINKICSSNTLHLQNSKKTLCNNFAAKLKSELPQYFSPRDQNNNTPKQIKKPQTTQQNKNQIPQLHNIVDETNNSMKNLLSKSIKQFQKFLSYQQKNQNLQQQNLRLKNSLYEMKGTLKTKLQIIFLKLKQNIFTIISNYTTKINKLLQDKQQLLLKIKQIQHQYTNKLKKAIQQKDIQIQSTKNQITDFLHVVQQYQIQASNEQNKFNQLNQKIYQLQCQNNIFIKKIQKYQCGNNQNMPFSTRTSSKSSKVEMLIELLQKVNKENNNLKTEISQLRSQGKADLLEVKAVREECQKKIKQLQQKHEEQFIRYNQTMTDTISKKDECIERLNQLIKKLRQHKSIN